MASPAKCPCRQVRLREGHSLAECQNTWSKTVSLRGARSPPGKVPAVGDTLQFVLAGVFEDESGTCDEVLHSLRDENLGGVSLRTDPSPYRDCDTTHVVAQDLALAGMQPRTDLNPEWLHPRRDRFGTPDRAGGTIEGREESVPHRL
jgi:hypothetical protein